ILNIYRKYYGARMTAFMLVTFYAAMVAASLVVEVIFAVAGWIPARPKTGSAAHTASQSITFNYTSILDIAFGLVCIALFT
ncbi:permease, partial [Paraburkholderia sp. SIMBA_054]